MFHPILRFLVCSDVHYQDQVTPTRERFEKFVSIGYRLAEECAEYPKLDALYICGDFTDLGTEKQFLAFRDSLARAVRPETKVVPLLGGHEYYHCVGEKPGDTDKLRNILAPEFSSVIHDQPFAEERLRRILGCEPDRHEVINGFHFISVSSTRDKMQWFDSYPEAKRNWVVEELRKATADTPKRPVFFFHHPHVAQTVYGEHIWSGQEFCLPLVNFPQVVDFSGHSHVACTDPRSIHQRDFTCMGTGGIYSLGYNDFNATGWSGEITRRGSQGLLVEANAEGDLRVRVIDVVEDVVRVERLIERPWDPDSYVYTDRRALTEVAPAFAADAVPVVSVEAGNVFVTFPQAQGETAQYTVNIRRAEDRSVAGRAVIWSQQVFLHPPKTLTVTLENIGVGEYVAEVEPKGYFGALGTKISAKFTV